MLSNETLREFLYNAYHNHGYAVGMEKVQGYIPGAKTFPEYVEETSFGRISYSDTYFGKRDSGGMSVVSLNNQPILLIQYRGGEPWAYVHDDKVQEINDFLKRAIKASNQARLPGLMKPTILYEDTKYAYVGFSRGSIWSLKWVEIIVRKDPGQFEKIKGELTVELFDEIVLLYSGGDDWIVFYHILNHQRIG